VNNDELNAMEAAVAGLAELAPERWRLRRDVLAHALTRVRVRADGQAPRLLVVSPTVDVRPLLTELADWRESDSGIRVVSFVPPSIRVDEVILVCCPTVEVVAAHTHHHNALIQVVP
jgi:hypothetical protein